MEDKKKNCWGNVSCVVVVVRRLGSWWETEVKERRGRAPRSRALFPARKPWSSLPCLSSAKTKLCSLLAATSAGRAPLMLSLQVQTLLYTKCISMEHTSVAPAEIKNFIIFTLSQIRSKQPTSPVGGGHLGPGASR